jgi:RNA polymerase sigma-70 factor (ECF subfamily)
MGLMSVGRFLLTQKGPRNPKRDACPDANVNRASCGRATSAYTAAPMALDPSMPESVEHEVTRLIAAWRGGDEAAREQLIERVYLNVRAIAAQSLRRMPNATLSATDLAHEALIRMLGAHAEWENRKHFFHVAAQATRQVLVDAARKRLSDKRGGGVERIVLDDMLGVSSSESDAQFLQIDDALRDLASTDTRRAQMIELVYFGGLSRAEVAETLAVSEGTVDRDLRLARAWLRTALEA